MKKRGRNGHGKGALQLIEEATHLLRILPPGITAVYYLGTIPFVLGLLYFVADMSKSAFAYRHEAEAALSMVFLFLWMKCWQALFCNRVKSYISGTPLHRVTFQWIARLCLKQTALQPLGFIVLPAAFIVTLPFGYAYAFFQNLSLMGDGNPGSIRTICRTAFDQAKMLPGQNHVALLTIILFSSFVFANVSLAMFMSPGLLKTFLGIETSFSLSGWGLLNTTFFAAAFVITHVLIDPLIKVFYVLRCFYGESISTGEDLKTELRGLRPAVNIMAALILLFLCGQAVASDVATAPEPRAREELSPAELDRSLGEVIVRKEYAWRLPRETKLQHERGPFAAFIDGIIDTMKDGLNAVRKWVVKALKWLNDHVFKNLRSGPGSAEKTWSGATQVLLYILVAIASCLLAIFIWRSLRSRKTPSYITGENARQVSDLSSDDVTADDLPADEWLMLARQLTEKGDLRLALRALYLGSLAHLALRGVVTVARYKSNRDYERELKRKAAHSPDLISAFSKNVATFENTWYGMHDISRELFSAFSENHRRITTLADRL